MAVDAYYSAKSKAYNITIDDLLVKKQVSESSFKYLLPESNLLKIILTLNFWINKYRQKQLDLKHHVNSSIYEYIDGGKKKFYNVNINSKETKLKTYERNQKQVIILRNELLSLLEADELYLVYNSKGKLRRVFRFSICNTHIYVQEPKFKLDPLNPKNINFKTSFGVKVETINLRKNEKHQFPVDLLADEEDLLSMSLIKEITAELLTASRKHVKTSDMIAFNE